MLTGDAPTTSKWSIILLHIKLHLILEIWQYISYILHDIMGPWVTWLNLIGWFPLPNSPLTYSVSISIRLLFTVATGLAEKKSLTFPWLPTQIPAIVAIYPGDFLQYIQNHIEITLFINQCFNIVALKKVRTRERFQHHENCWYLVPKIKQTMKTNHV